MENALLEEHIRYGEARFRDKELVRPFVNRIYQDITELEEAMKPKSCDGCKQSWKPNNQTFHKYFCDYLQIPTHGDFCCNRYEPKETKC